jgi:hypothetical protein
MRRPRLGYRAATRLGRNALGGALATGVLGESRIRIAAEAGSLLPRVSPRTQPTKGWTRRVAGYMQDGTRFQDHGRGV